MIAMLVIVAIAAAGISAAIAEDAKQMKREYNELKNGVERCK